MPHHPTRSPKSPTAGRRTYPFIDAIRGVASLVILAHHLVTYVPRSDETLRGVPVLYDAVWWYGGLATQVFLVISGFVGGVSLARATPEAADLGRLMLVRYLRLALPAVATLLFAIVLYALVPPSWAAFPLFDEITAAGVLAHVAFLQDVLGYPSLLAGFWYLSIDWQCNAVMCLLIIVQDAILRRLPGLSRSALSRFAPSRFAPSRFAQGFAVVGLPMLVALPSLFFWNGAVAHEVYATYFFGIVFLGTLAGLAVAGRIPPAIFWAYVAAVAIAVVVQRRPHPAVGLIAGVAMYLLARQQPSAASPANSLLAWLGGISYALFLVHYPTIWAVTSVARGVGGDAAAASWPSLTVAVAASLVAAVLLHRLVEVPTLALVARIKPGRRHVSPATAPLVTPS
jgi:peptidoglycan/LPS O-acetylase OafA/YrhL